MKVSQVSLTALGLMPHVNQAVAAVCRPSPAPVCDTTNLIRNGDFTSPAQGSWDSSSAFYIFSPSDAPNGGNVARIVGSYVPITLSQVITTVAGYTYNVRFDYWEAYYQYAPKFTCTIKSGSQTYTFSPNTLQQQLWGSYSNTFQAQDSTSTFTLSIGSPVADAVTVEIANVYVGCSAGNS